jgi:hypothetical protein
MRWKLNGEYFSIHQSPRVNEKWHYEDKRLLSPHCVSTQFCSFYAVYQCYSLILTCLFGSICPLNNNNTHNNLNYFSKTISKRHKTHSLEAIKNILSPRLFCFGNGRCIWHVVGGVIFATKEQNALSNLTVQICPVTRDEVQSFHLHQKWSISQVCLLSRRFNTNICYGVIFSYHWQKCLQKP